MEESKTESQRSAKRVGILVIHGIGEQDPYETMDSFAKGLVRYFRDVVKVIPSLRPERLRHRDWTEVALHLEFSGKEASPGPQDITLFEFYWAPYTEDKVTYLDSLKWLIRADLTPLRLLSSNLQELRAAQSKRTLGGIIWIFLREILRAVLFYVPMLFLLLLAYLWVSDLPSLAVLTQDLTVLQKSAPLWASGTMGICAIMAICLLGFCIHQLGHLGRHWRDSAQRLAEITWLVLALLLTAVFCAMIWVLGARYPDFVWTSRSLLLDWQTVELVGTVLGVLWLRRVLIDYVGDVAVYVAADEKSKSYVARSAILKSSTDSLRRLLKDPGLDKVIVAGHSLGSVIAYDTVNRVLSETWASQAHLEEGSESQLKSSELDKLKGLVTFGSPLDKIYYFFRRQVPDTQPVRAQVLSFLHSFRRGYSGREYGDYRFSYNPDPNSSFPDLSRDFRWLNVWSATDPISGRLDFYRLDPADQLSRWYWWPPLLAHLRYWGDEKFYRFIAKRLL